MAANSRAPTSSKSDSCSARPELTTTTAQQHHAVRCSRHQGQMSGHNLHRRATVSELQALFDRSPAAGGQNTPDPVGHWYEAQLLHYGLAPSKNKAVAKVRLLDALRAGSLNVPKDILKVEGDLKKEWKKKDKETKSGSGSDSGGTAKSSTSGNNKRKRDDKDAGETAQTPKATAKKIKTADLAATKTETETGQKSSQSAKSSSTKKGSGGKAATAKKNEPQKESEPAPKRQTAKRGGSTASSKTKPPAISSQGPEPKAAPKRQTARRSKPFFGGRLPTDPAIKQEYYNTPPLGSMHPSDADSMGVPSDEDDWSDNGPEDASNMPLPPLGLINGEYQIYSQDLNDWSDYPEEEFNLILGLAGNSMWGSYDFGIFYGIMHLQERPWSSSSRRIPFEWRGRDRGEGEMSFGPSCTGWISFLGDGHIQDQLGGCHGEGKFSGDRISGNKTQPPRDVRSMREEWNGYNQVEYDNENRRRWGGW